MRIISVSYNSKPHQANPHAWLESIHFYVGILEALSAYDEVISIDLINWEGELQKNGVRHIFKLVHTAFFKLNYFVKQLQPDIVLIHGFGFMPQVIHLGLIKPASIKIFVQHHAEKPVAGWRRSLFKMGDRFITGYYFATKKMADPWIGHKLIRSSNKVLGIPEASSVFYPVSKTIAGEHTNITAGKVFLWVGRLNDNKDPLTLINAFADYVKINAAAKLCMVYQENDLLEAVKKVIADKNISSNVLLAGKVPRKEMLFWFNSAEFIICSSYYEGCNISVMEGMSCGCIPIVTKTPSFDLHTDNSRLGFRFNAGNAKELLECLQKSGEMDLETERHNVLNYFEAHLSFRAIAGKMRSAVVAG